MTGALKIDDAAGRQAIAELTETGLLADLPGEQARVGLTDAGRALHQRIRTAVDRTVARLYADLPADDLATAGRVLTIITARANAELAAA